MADILASVSVVLGAEVSGFKAAMADARRELRGLVQFAEGLKSVGESLTKYVTVPALAIGGAALKIGGDFQAEFNKVQAATQATGAELESLRKKAQTIALDPSLKFSSVQAAQALEALAKNGLSVADILGGAADASTNLATATGADLAVAADITTDVMNNFGKSAKDAAGLVSNITGTTIASKFAIDDYKLALGQAGGVAGQLGVSFEDFNTALGVTSSGFSSGQDAGTSFKTFLQRLVPQSKEAEKAIKQLGLNFFDAQGKMRPLREIAGQLQEAFKNLSDQDRNKFGSQIFGSDAIRTALLLAKDGAAGFDKMAESISKVDAAAQGKILNQGFVGALEAFKSAAEGAAQAIAESGILDFATDLAKRGAEIATALATADPAVLKFGVGLVAAAAAIGPILVAVGSLGVALPALTAGFALLAGPVGLIVAGVAAAAVLIVANWGELVAYFKPTGEGGQVFSNLAVSIKDSVAVIGAAIQGIANIGGGTLGDLISVGTTARAVFREIAVGITALSDIIGGIIGTVVKLFRGDFGGALEEAKRAVFGLIDPLANLFGFTKKAGVELKGTFADAFKPLIDESVAGAVAGGELSGALESVAASLTKTIGLTDAQTGALAKLEAELLNNRNASRALGGLYDFAGGKSSILTAGIKNLTDAGFAPGGKVVQAYVAQLRAIPVALDEISGRVAKGVEGLFKTPEFKLDAADFKLPLPEKLAPIDVSSYQNATAAVVNSKAVLVDASQAINASLQDLAVSFGETLGALASGQLSLAGGLSAIFDSIINVMADFSVSFGKQLIAQAIAIQASYAALSNPLTALAAGVALVAIGSAIRGSLSGSGPLGGGQSIGGGSSSFTSPNYGSRTNAASTTQQTIRVEVTGTLRAANGALTAALEADKYRKLRTN